MPQKDWSLMSISLNWVIVFVRESLPIGHKKSIHTHMHTHKHTRYYLFSEFRVTLVSLMRIIIAENEHPLCFCIHTVLSIFALVPLSLPFHRILSATVFLWNSGECGWTKTLVSVLPEVKSNGIMLMGLTRIEVQMCVFLVLHSKEFFSHLQPQAMGGINPLIRVSLRTLWRVCMFTFLVNGRKGHYGGHMG